MSSTMKVPSSAVFASLSSTITEISRLSGIPGVAIGMIDNGKIIHQASYGLCDVEKQIPCDSDSTFVLGSLTKAFTSALLAQLVQEGRLSWTDPLSQDLPGFQRDPQDLSSHTTIGDLLCHHTGLSACDSLWLGSDHVPLLNHSDAIKILNYVLGHVIEKRLLRPLGMKRTYFTDRTEQMENEAKPYAALSDATLIRISPALQGDHVLMGPAGGVRSSVSDLLLFYNALLDAAAEHVELGTERNFTPKDQPVSFSELPAMWTGWNALPLPLVREHSYGYGWLRSQLPSVLAPSRGDPDLNPLVGTGAPSRLAIWHCGDIPGYQTHATLFPETKQAVVVLTNSLSLNDGTRYINDLVIEALLDNLDNAHDYLKLAKRSRDLASIHKGVVDGRTRSEPCRPLDSYVGRYFNRARNFLIDRDAFELKTYQDDSFFWFLTHNEAARLARYDGYGEDFYILRFGSVKGDDDVIDALWWKHEPSFDGFGEVFERHSASKNGPSTEQGSEL
ncbi:beta-lactamase/transpeptidase-like protein [Fusarium solani]|uniref:Beta-lactamase/transpeptidase-like protein n=1 Tax=Fusarium solani TaxID=169388 RepID=A0A9P9GE55_FUSSL|nr:beta-lactamase/transpeptidase-like protein [Fusarium solani]KAH7237246.1 beta-lactamase/transpeptidase-like protein [Fusarium solani]